MDGQDDRTAIENLNAAWLAAVRAKDVDALVGMVTDDVVFLPSGAPPIRGRAAVAAMYRSFFPQFASVEQTATVEEIDVSGDWAFQWGSETLTLKPAGGGPLIRFAGKGMTVLRRESGAWKFARGINNSARQ
jgi:uncharacterized protein (TIGR02246 family)